MRSTYGKECAKHPELAGRRYLPNNNCIKCHSESMKEHNARRRSALLELIEAAEEIRFKEPRIDAALKGMRK
jgi:hypothetical protein